MTETRGLRTRIPGQAVIGEFLRRYRATARRSRIARFFGLSPLTTETRSWYRGALGEIVVGDALDTLGPQWDVLHAVPVGSGESDIDHVVIGPPGVFTVNTKNHSAQDVCVTGSTFTVSGKRYPYISNAIFEAKRAARLLSEVAGRPVEVTAMLVVVDPHRLTVRASPADFVVISSRQLMRWFDRAPRTLTGDEVAFISDVVDRPTTWRTTPAIDEDVDELHREFAAVRSEVNAAIRRRVFWGCFGVAVSYLLLWLSVATFVSKVFAASQILYAVTTSY